MRYLIVICALLSFVVAAPAASQSIAKKVPETRKAREARRHKEGLILLKRVKVPAKPDVVDISCPSTGRDEKYCKYLRVAWHHMVDGNWGSALKFSARALNMKPHSSAALARVGAALFHLESCAEAIPYLRPASRLDLTYSSIGDFVFCNLGQNDPRAGQEARWAAEILARRGAGWEWYALATMVLVRGDRLAARHYLTRLLGSQRWDRFYLASLINMRLGGILEAINNLERGLEEDGSGEIKTRKRLASLYLSMQEPAAALEELDALQELEDQETWVADKRAEIAANFEGDYERAAKLTTDAATRAAYTFDAKLAQGELDAFPQELVKDLRGVRQFWLLFYQGKDDEAVEKAWQARSQGEISDEEHQRILFVKGECGMLGHFIRQFSGGLATSVRRLAYKRAVLRRCANLRPSLRVRFSVADRFTKEDWEYGWIGVVAASADEAARAHEMLGHIKENSMGEAHVAAAWGYAKLGERAMVLRHLKVARAKGAAIPWDRWALVYCSAINEDVGQVRADLAALPKSVRSPVLDPWKVAQIREIVRALTKVDLVFAGEVIDTYMVLDGPLERWSRGLLNGAPHKMRTRP